MYNHAYAYERHMTLRSIRHLRIRGFYSLVRRMRTDLVEIRRRRGMPLMEYWEKVSFKKAA